MPEAAARFERFRQLVLSDAALAARLLEHREDEAFVAEVVAEGARRDLEFTAEQVRAAMREGLRTWRASCGP